MNDHEYNDRNIDNDPQDSMHSAFGRTEQTSYTTPGGGSGVHYSRREWEGTYHAAGESGQPPIHRHKRLMAVLAIALCLALGLGAGMAGSIIFEMLQAQDSSNDPSSMLSGDVSTVFPGTENIGIIGNHGKTPSESDRNPTPEMNKSDSLGTITYSGSAGDAAYSTLAEAIDRVAETVVEISTETMVNGGWLGNYVRSGAGSGVIVSEDGYIVTNNHVISGADTITVRTTNGKIYTAALIGADAASDIAVLWVDTGEEQLPAAQLGCSADLIVGEPVFAIGNPLGSLGGTVTDGIISATARSITIDGENMTLLQTNAAVNPGNSGGGLFNMAGQLIGVVNAKCSEDDVEGLGFAIPVDTAYEVICELIEYGYVRGVVDTGLTLYDITASNIMVARRYFNSNYAGVYIWESTYSDEFKYGDLLYSIDGTTVASSDEVAAVLKNYEVGDVVTVTVIRGQKKHEIALELREYVPSDLKVQFDQK